MKDFSQPRSRVEPALLAAGVLCVVLSRLCHLDLVWIEEAYGMAAAAELLRGRSLYADIWFDKPPLYAIFYTLCGGGAGWPLRLLGIAWILLCAASVGLLARRLWDTGTGTLAAALTCFSLTFWLPSAVMAIAPDLLMFVPHVLAIWAIATGRPLLAGALAGVAVLTNSKGLLILPVLIGWKWRESLPVLAGFTAVQALSFAMVPADVYLQQVWWWGSQYSADTFIQQPFREFTVRTAGWAAFHAAAVIGTGVYLWRSRDWHIALWLVLALAGVIAGLRFFPRYYFHLLPVVIVAGARGLLMLPYVPRMAVLLLLLVPVARFGPRYLNLAVRGTAGWADTAMMEDSRESSRLVRSGSVLVWGYRPDIFVFSGRPAATRFLDSQPLTGVLADRHLTVSQPTVPNLAAENRRELVKQLPDYIVDGLGPLNPDLAITRYSDLKDWLSAYEEVGRTRMSVVFKRKSR